MLGNDYQSVNFHAQSGSLSTSKSNPQQTGTSTFSLIQWFHRRAMKQYQLCNSREFSSTETDRNCEERLRKASEASRGPEEEPAHVWEAGLQFIDHSRHSDRRMTITVPHLATTDDNLQVRSPLSSSQQLSILISFIENINETFHQSTIVTSLPHILWIPGRPPSRIRNVVRSQKRIDNSDTSTSSSIRIPPARVFLSVRRRMLLYLAYLNELYDGPNIEFGSDLGRLFQLSSFYRLHSATLLSRYGITQANPS
ncbi:hypothetical protein Moror_15438 [Moniliophthora roreri MCA 2997]|uniref:Uncharacterized protein n=1 Tax=Moniliophthora roreri (strain MCA 2997) TaxID=1381753 RepID=V2WJW5_MONRO|nr:hypothetical protein Moror_15438 [Moniliophthora roreri MCA 2997]